MGGVPLGSLIVAGIAVTLLAAILVGAEAAVARLTRAAVDDLVEDGRARAPRLETLLEQRRRTLLSARAARVALQVLATVSFTLVLTQTRWAWWVVFLVSIGVNWVVAFFVISLLPQSVARRYPEGVALFATPLLELLIRASQMGEPFVRLAAQVVPASPQTDAEARAEMAEEMREVVDQVGETEGFEAEDREMMRSVIELGYTLVREVMVPRTDMVTIHADVAARKALGLFVRSGYSRVPVIGDDIDDVIGILYLKDLLGRIHRRPDDLDVPVRHICRDPRFVPEMKRADDELRAMQSERVHMVLVVDEYGGIAGLLTIEDLIEEIVGEVNDEHDRHVVEPEEIEHGVWRVPSRFPIDELGELLGRELEDDDVDSVGGLLTKAIGRVPLPGAEGEILGLILTAEDAVGRRRQVASIIARLAPTEDGEDSEEGD